MENLLDAVLLSRIQFFLTAAYHYVFVPMSIGTGLVVAINETRYYKNPTPENEAASKFWIKLFGITFAIGVATGITMEFSFGTNWADYSRYVGNIFGAPLAAEALLAFFMESVFLGILLLGRGKVGPKGYLASAWLVWIGSCLSALWIIIANSWMNTPAGAEMSEDGIAILTDFFAAALNYSTLPRYAHVICAVLLTGSFMSMGVGGYYLRKGQHEEFASKAIRTGAVCGIVFCCALMVSAHASAVTVAEEQPTKLAMMEGQYDDEAADLYLFGWVDEESGEVIAPFSIEGGTSWLASGDTSTVYEGLNTLSESETYGDLDVEDAPVNLVFQSYHLMVAMAGLMVLVVVLALLFTRRGKKITNKWLQRLFMICPFFPMIAIQAGWATTEFGRQPWVVYPATSSGSDVSLLTADAISQSVSVPELVITLVLFLAIYGFLFIAWIRILAHVIKTGPVLAAAKAAEAPRYTVYLPAEEVEEPADEAAEEPEAEEAPAEEAAEEEEGEA